MFPDQYNNLPKTILKKHIQAIIDEEVKRIANSTNWDRKMECKVERIAFFTLKIQTDNFKQNVASSLINRSKGKMGIARKNYQKNRKN